MENDDLAQHLESLQRENCYRVDAVLKQSPVEVTQRVYFSGSTGAESGPYIRKFIKRGHGIGAVYERIFAAQQRGRRFKYIPDVLECYTRDDELVVIMELVRGKTLQEYVYEADPSLQLARDVFPKLCDAVSELHEEFDPPIIHRDLKPSNVILNGEGLALIDFGISREFREGAESDTTHFGTREFAPPEQYGFGQTTVRSDIFSLGMVLYYCLTEEIPTSRARENSFHDERIPEQMRAVIEGAAELDPAERFASAGELKAAFLAAAKDCEGSDVAGTPQPSSGGTRRKGVLLAIVGVACVLIAAIVGFAVIAPGEIEPDSSIASDTAEAMKISSPEKGEFDSGLNFPVTIAGLEFQIPEYFKARSMVDEDGSSFYYAESGESVVMIMTSEVELDWEEEPEDLDAYKDSFVEDMLKSSEFFDKGSAVSTDYMIAGRPARSVSYSATVESIPTKLQSTLFFEKDWKSVGVILLCQTENAIFDYSEDFGKILASARPVS